MSQILCHVVMELCTYVLWHWRISMWLVQFLEFALSPTLLQDLETLLVVPC